MTPLAGVRVLDLSRLLPGPFASKLLRDLGARVDKVEDPDGGDYLRRTPPRVDGINSVFQVLNAGNRSAVLDLKKPEGRDALLRLVLSYDVLVEGFRPGVMARLGLGWDELRSVHPRLVYCALTGYGQEGPLAARAGHDINYLARAGVLGLTGPAEGPPQVPGVQLADFGGGLFAASAVLAALFGRERTGEGRFVDVSMCDAAVGFAAYGLASHLGGVPVDAGTGPLSGGIAPYGCYRTRDGRAVALGALEPKFWEAFCRGVGIEPDMEAIAPGPHQQEWKARLAGLFAERTLDEWRAFGEAHDCCLEPVLEPEEVATDPHLAARGAWRGATGDPFRLGTPLGMPPPDARAPGQGEHTQAILREGGFSPSEVDSLLATGIARGSSR